jgi:hypothetical protein
MRASRLLNLGSPRYGSKTKYCAIPGRKASRRQEPAAHDIVDTLIACDVGVGG